MSGLDRAAADATIRANHAAFAELLSMGEELLRRRRVAEAAETAQAAASSAWMRHAGIHASPRLERLVRSIAPVGRPWHATSGSAGHVLHVLSQVYLTGGHTRWSDRIIRADGRRRHSVVLVAQGGAPIPGWLRETVAISGGTFAVLEPGTVLQRATALRRAIVDAAPDLVLANVHPNDVASVAVLADPRTRPPVAALNHADHTFWLGASAWDLVAEFRGSGRRLGARRRGIPDDRAAILPLPVDPPRNGVGREEARRRLGLGPDEIVLLSAGSAWKFDPLELRGEPTFPEVLAPIVAADERIRCFVLGPLPSDRWADAARATDARLHALGTRTDYELFQEAADIYLDPFPMGSGYSLLEPGSRGLPLLTFDQWPGTAEVLTVDSPGLTENRIRVRDRGSYEAALLRLIDDVAERRERGARTAADVMAAHAGPGWQAALDGVVSAAPAARAAHLATPIRLAPDLDEPVFDDLTRGLATILERTPPVPDRVVVHLPLTGGPAAA